MPQGRQYGLFLCFWVQGWFTCGRKEGVVMLTCGDLKNLPVLQKIKYLTGDSGLANPIHWTFVLAPFLAQEERTCRGLLETLESYFACNGNTIKAAELLFVHRNTVKYRLGQAEAILGCSLSDAGVRLKVQLALYIRSQEQDNGKKV